MAKRSSTKRDFMQIAREVVEKAIGEHMDGTPLEPDTRDPHFVAIGRAGGKKGGSQPRAIPQAPLPDSQESRKSPLE